MAVSDLKARYEGLWKEYLYQQFFVEPKNSKFSPIKGIVGFMQALARSERVELVLITPFDYPEFKELADSYQKAHLLHTSSANNWKITPEQLDQWCLENEVSAKGALVYLPKSLSGVSWKAGELKRLAEIARKFDLVFIREEFMHTPAEESLFHFLPHSSLIYMNPFHSFRGSSWHMGNLNIPKVMDMELIIAKCDWESLLHDASELDTLMLQVWMEEYSEHTLILNRWNDITSGLRKEVNELLRATKLKFSSADQGISLLLDFEGYRVPFGRKEIYTNSAICREIQNGCGVQLVPGSQLGLSPNMLVASMGLSNIGSLNWIEEVENVKVDASFLYKHFWNCIDGVQKLTKYLNALS